MKRFSVVILTSLISLLPVVGNAADLPDEQWSIMTGYNDKAADVTGVTLLGVSIEDTSNLSEHVSNMIGHDPKITGETGLRICKSIDDSFCKTSSGGYLYAILPVCKSTIELNCISGVSAIKDGVEFAGEYKRNFPEKGYTDFPANSVRNIPEGSTPSIWSFPGLTHTGGTSDYLVNFGVTANFWQIGPASFTAYDANISPVSIKAGRYGRNQTLDGTGKDPATCFGNCGLELRGWSQDDKFVCASLDDGYCALREAFPTNVRFRLNVRLSQSPTGWLHGRMKSPNISIVPTGGGIAISIEAEPVAVPVIGILEDKSKLPASIINDTAKQSGFSWSHGPYNPATSNKLIMVRPDSPEAFQALQTWKDLIKDKANASPTQWTVRTLSAIDVNSSCFQKTTELIGIVTTNSLVYLGSPPTFNKETQSLDYKVASPHFTSTGEVFKGTYDLQLRSDVARCLYGFSNAPISAKISVISESGDANIATTVVNEKDGWMRMAAYGFTFSSPTLRIQLTQPKVESSAASSTAKPTSNNSVSSNSSSARHLTSVTCTKGKVIKRISGTNPKCPAGYKRRAA